MIKKQKPCKTKHCRNKVTSRNYCGSCRNRKSRLKDPVKYAYTTLKNNAKRRNKCFTITLDQFRAWCHKVNFIGLKRGRDKDSFSVDRRIEAEGYTPDNIQPLTLSSNVKKYLHYDWQSKVVYELKPVEPVKTDLPF